jgi:FixJ family two-component response regulator
MIRAILVDDKQSHLNLLIKNLQLYYNDVEIIGAYTKPQEAISQIIYLEPDVLFLDIEIPGTSGFELAAKVAEICSNVIYLTNYLKFGSDSYKYNAIYFIDKNRIEEFLPEAIVKLKVRFKQEKIVKPGLASTHKIKRLSILGNRKIVIVLFDGKEEKKYELELSVESDKTLSKFIFFKINSGNENRYINQKQDNNIFINLSQSKTHFINDVNNQLLKYNIILSQKDFFREEARGKYTFALAAEKIDLPTDPGKLKDWRKTSMQPLADLLKLPLNF